MDTHAPGSESFARDLLLAEGRILEAVAGGTILLGDGEEVPRRLGLGAEIFRAALRELDGAGWIFAVADEAGRLLAGWERRMRDLGPPGPVERRRPRAAWLA